MSSARLLMENTSYAQQNPACNRVLLSHAEAITRDLRVLGARQQQSQVRGRLQYGCEQIKTSRMGQPEDRRTSHSKELALRREKWLMDNCRG